MAAVASEVIWIKSFLASWGVFLTRPIRLQCDNQAALHIARKHVFHERTKHIEIDCHFIPERMVSGELAVSYPPSKYQLANIFTKALDKQQFQFLVSKLGIINPYAPT